MIASRLHITQRELRLGSGLLLLSYIATHLLNHALGLVSVPLAERWLAASVALWHSLPGSVLLYGAVATHIALALYALYLRRTLRMPPLELLRIVMGLGIPLALIGHVVFTRAAWELYEATPRYARVVWSLWLSDGEARQLAMLVPGWLHGCLGVHFAFGRRPLYRRLQLPLFALALLVPVLGGLGFLAMAKELAADPALRPQLEAAVTLGPAAQEGLERLRETVLFVYFGLIGAVFGARELRSFVERRRKLLIEIAYPQRRIRVPLGFSVLEASRSHHLPHLAMCGGRARCTTCRVRITAGATHCPPPAGIERDALQRIDAADDVRLACQLRPSGDIGVLPLLAAAGAQALAAPTARATERNVALLAVSWRNQAAFAQASLPQDLVFAAQAFADTACGALRAHGGTVVEVRGDSVLAAFGLATPMAQACRDALAAARSVEQALGPVIERHTRAFGASLDCAVFVHAGPATVGPLASGGTIVVGEALEALRRLQATAGDATRVVSVAALEQAGVGTGAETQLDFGGIPAVAGRERLTASTQAATAS